MTRWRVEIRYDIAGRDKIHCTVIDDIKHIRDTVDELLCKVAGGQYKKTKPKGKHISEGIHVHWFRAWPLDGYTIWPVGE